MNRPRLNPRVRRGAAWLLALVLFTDVNWWLGALIPLQRPFLFLTVVLVVSVPYGVFVWWLNRMMKWSLGEWSRHWIAKIVLPLVLLVGVLGQEALKGRSGSQMVTTSLALITGATVAECWPDFLNAVRLRAGAFWRDAREGLGRAS